MSAPASRWNRWLLAPPVKPALFVVSCLPLVGLIFGIVAERLGANPAEALMRSTGGWTLRFLWLTLAITPLRELSGWSALARWRRMLGLFTFFYACLHFLCFAWLDVGFDVGAMLRDITKRPFILVGSAALLTLLPLAATSFNRAAKALGAVRWRALHRLVYATTLLALLHFFWMRAGKNDFAEVAVYGLILVGLLGWRVMRRLRQRA